MLERVRLSDDEQAWEEFVGYYQGFIEVILIKMGVMDADRDDLKQDILLSIWKDLKKMEPGKNNARFRSWLSTVIRNRSNSYFKMRNRRLVREDKHATPESDYVPSDLDDLIDRDEFVVGSEGRLHLGERRAHRRVADAGCRHRTALGTRARADEDRE